MIKLLDKYTAEAVFVRAARATVTTVYGRSVVVKVRYASFDYCVEVVPDRRARITQRRSFQGLEVLVACATVAQDAAIRARLVQLA